MTANPLPRDLGLRDVVNEYLRGCAGWREHPEHANTYMQWEDLRAVGEHDSRTLPTDLAAIRQMAYEASQPQSGHSLGPSEGESS